jgi:hypothetical protein
MYVGQRSTVDSRPSTVDRRLTITFNAPGTTVAVKGV